jgi:Fe-S oxidoreductase
MEVGGDDHDAAVDAARSLGDGVCGADARARVLVVTDPVAQRAMWRIRDDAAGSATRLADGTEAWPGWEDAAVPVEHLADYLARFRALLAAYELRGVPYGHFGEGCVHVRIGFDLVSPAGIGRFESFLDAATDLVVEYGGSFSGEHGDGLARGQYLPKLYGPDVMSLFRRFKEIWDPHSLMNPGIIAKPEPVTTTLRFGSPSESTAFGGTAGNDTSFTYPDDAGSFAQAVRRCVGVGRCVQHGAQAQGAAMCPSFQVIRDERHSTRGRAHLLGEMLRGDLITDGWHSDDVAEALDLCLGCKACLSECPVSVDMASYKTEFLHRHYAGRVRPATHYAMGWLPLWARLGTVAPRLANLLTHSRMTGGPVRRLGGIAPRRGIPAIAPTTLRAALRHRRARVGVGGRRVLLWPDTFTSYFAPEVGVAAIRVLEDAGFAVEVPRRAVCFGLTWLSTGQLDVARRVARRSLAALPPDIPIVGLEPSCTTALRNDLPQLLDSEAARAVSGNTYTLAEFLEAHAPDWQPRPHRRQAVGQVHCHQAATAGYAAEHRLLAAAGVELTVPQASCCGLAGDFGMARDRYDLSVACAEQGLAQAVRAADEDTMIVADGFSCRLQIADLTGRRPHHTAQLLSTGLV